MATTAQVHRYGSLSADDVAALDAAAVALGIAVEQLMEVAGFQVARLAWRMLGRRPGSVRVVAGRGHNGGDGLVAARHLAGWGCAVDAVVLAEPDRLDDLSMRQCAAATGAGVAVLFERAAPRGVALTVDAVLGTGTRGPLRPDVASQLALLQPPILSVDVPSGMDATIGVAAPGTVRAAATLTLGGCKQGLWAATSRAWTGTLYSGGIGMPVAAWARAGVAPPRVPRGDELVRVPPPM